MVEIKIDGHPLFVSEGATILEGPPANWASKRPTLCLSSKI